MGDKLGRGCFATVFKATRRHDGKLIAIKVVEKHRLDEDTAQLLQNELQILQTVSEHPGIVTLLDHIETNTNMYFVMEFVDGGPLLDRIVSRGRFSENDARIMFRSILLTLQYLSELGCVHRDIKPENILVDNAGMVWPVKLTDFGLSAKMQPDELLYGALGTPLFVAPEILKGDGYDCSCDMWSLGVVMYIVLCGYPPFPFYDGPTKLISAIVSCNYSFPAPEWDRVSSDAKDVLKRILEADPKRRLTPTEALSHRWVTLAQSTTDLPNAKLRSFNARRKLKATVVAVRTTFDLMNIVKPSTRVTNSLSRQRALIEDVEKSRAIIAKLGMLDDKPVGKLGEKREPGPKPKPEPEPEPEPDPVPEPEPEPEPALEPEPEPAPEPAPEPEPEPELELEQLKLRPCRRSLILPMHMFDDLSSDADFQQTQPSEEYGRGMQFAQSLLHTSQVMQSKAKAMVAEAKGSPLHSDHNPFSIGEEESPRERKRASLKTLDFKSLGIS